MVLKVSYEKAKYIELIKIYRNADKKGQEFNRTMVGTVSGSPKSQKAKPAIDFYHDLATQYASVPIIVRFV